MTISTSIIRRLFEYRRCLYEFQELGFKKIFSENLAESAGVTSVQVRKDFSILGITGKRRGGYELENLIDSLNRILKKDQKEKVILVGAGNLGTALLEYKGFERDGVQIVAAFDVDPAKIKRSNHIPVLPLEKVAKFVKDNNIKIAILTVPKPVAQEICDKLVKSKIKGILNFAPAFLRVPQEVTVQNVLLATELDNLVYYVRGVKK